MTDRNTDYTVREDFSDRADDRGRVSFGSEFGTSLVSGTIERSFNLDNLPAMFAQHHMRADWAELAGLYAGYQNPDVDAYIGIDWGTGPVTHPQIFEDHPKDPATSDRRRLDELQSVGAVVAAYYGARSDRLGDHAHSELDNYMKIGIAPPGQRIQKIPVEFGRPEEVPEEEDRDFDIGEKTFVKAYPLVDAVEVTRSDYPDLFGLGVRGLSIFQPDSSRGDIKAAYEKEI